MELDQVVGMIGEVSRILIALGSKREKLRWVAYDLWERASNAFHDAAILRFLFTKTVKNPTYKSCLFISSTLRT